ncbi:Uncharacterised protein [Serratia entomophila]|nr:Uncharacterised protein [Serratia entomophila]CAI0830189.1 Uncharacterised protein [Serratia entomophila]CAI0906315.1 Uncharacterised protein [Serratia entomophila]CAI1759130.1 Uncharacterised protein [Serratia entomophila]CAI2053454.1 Uncharacterised protein [Serratia entomophila]
MRVISSVFVVLFIVFSMLGTIKIYIGGNLNWLIQLILLIVAVVSSLAASPLSMMQTVRERLRCLGNYKLMLFGWLLFMAGIAIAAFMNHGTGLYTVAKYLAFMFVLLCLLLISPLSPSLLERALSVTLVVSLVPLIILALFRQLDAMVILGDGRMGWLASWPGVIWKIGAFVWPFAVWRCLKKPSALNILLAFGAVLTMALDGSRTSMLWLVLVWISLAVIAIFAKTYTKPIRTHLSLLLVTFISFSLIQPVLLGWVSGHYDQLITQLMEKKAEKNEAGGDDLNRVFQKTLDAPKEATADRLVKGDNSIRLQMLHTGWQQTVDKFPWGGGFGSTRVDDFGASSVIHMTYLQLLADEGVLSFVGYLLFILCPLYYGLKFVTEKRELFTERFELMLSPLSVLALFLFMGCFHPLSNELTEWAIVLTAISIVMSHVPRRN